MDSFLIDSNILLDIFTEDKAWSAASGNLLARCIDNGRVFINPIIYAEVSIGFSRVEQLESALPADIFLRAELPWDACFLAGKCFLTYRKRGGLKTTPLPDFFIGAHAAIANLVLVTRDAKSYKTYFPRVKILSPVS